MCAVAAEVADGLITHPTNSHPRYLAQVVLPALGDRAPVGDHRPAMELFAMVPLIAGRNASEVAVERERQRRRLAFVFSTPAYRPTLELSGWGEHADQLHRLSREGDWDGMVAVVTDALLDDLYPHGSYDERSGESDGKAVVVGDEFVSKPSVPGERVHQLHWADVAVASASG